jgi:hypothetical protein
MHMWQWFIAILAACFYLGLASAGFWASFLGGRLTHRTRKEPPYSVEWPLRAAARSGRRETPG